MREKIEKPYLISCHTNFHAFDDYDINTVFSSRNHAQRNGSEVFVYNGVDTEELGPVDFNRKRNGLLFMAYAKRPEKNLKDCRYIARKTKNVLKIIGLKNKWFRRLQPGIECKGFLGGQERNAVIQSSKALLFPVRWHEPFGIAVIECMYFGLPVFASSYGSLPELVKQDVGFVSDSRSRLVEAIQQIGQFNPKRCHEYVCEQFTSKHMTDNYLNLYQKVLAGHTLNAKPPVNGGNFSPQELLPFYV